MQTLRWKHFALIAVLNLAAAIPLVLEAAGDFPEFAPYKTKIALLMVVINLLLPSPARTIQAKMRGRLTHAQPLPSSENAHES